MPNAPHSDPRDVIRFPIERRIPPSLALLCEIEPDPRAVEHAIDAFRIERPDTDLRIRADASMAETILDTVAMESGPMRSRMLDELERTVLQHAVETCHEARRLQRRADEALDAWSAVATSYQGFERQATTDRATTAAATSLVHAYEVTQRAHGALRAIRLARENAFWTRPPSTDDNSEWLISQAEGS